MEIGDYLPLVHVVPTSSTLNLAPYVSDIVDLRARAGHGASLGTSPHMAFGHSR